MNPLRQIILAGKFEKIASDDSAFFSKNISINDIVNRLGGAFTTAGQHLGSVPEFLNKNKAGIGTGLGLAAGLYGLGRMFMPAKPSPSAIVAAAVSNPAAMDDETAIRLLKSRLPSGSSIYSQDDIEKIKRNAYIKAGLGGLAIGGSLGSLGGYSAGRRRGARDSEENLNALRSQYSNPYDMYRPQRGISPYEDYYGDY
jgi:hypothetical protein